ncbi:MAG TPA: DUF1592 domain-containing protein [Bryobacteraceae bacterium]|nr:DUF1592 domain-containing protein [Bryobacteraceae bacterium]
MYRWVLVTLAFAAFASGAETDKFLRTWCLGCHVGAKAAGNFRIDPLLKGHTLRAKADDWINAARRVRNAEMPPRNAPQPPLDHKETFLNWVDTSLRAEACASGPVPGPAPLRRLNREEYAATVRDLLNVNVDVGHGLPAEGAGGEGFDNTAETLFLSPLHAEKYLEAAKQALDFASTDARAKARIFITRPSSTVTETEAARNIIGTFLPRAWRRPVGPQDGQPYLRLFESARKAGEPFEPAVLFALKSILVSPRFLFRYEPANASSEPKLLDDFSLASRLSYFLWGSAPDEMLWDIAQEGKLNEPEVLKSQIARMLRHGKATDSVRRFVEQWLRTRDLARDKTPDAKLFPIWAESEEVRSDIRYQPVLFFREIFARNFSVLDLIDSDWTILNRTLARLYDVPVQWRKDAARALYRVKLPEASDRGGLLGMPAVLTVSSYPNRTSPVLRGAWVLDAILGTPPPPPPPGVPPLEAEHAAKPATVRERLIAHRANPVCGSCHSRFDGLGFALENYDAMGFWRTEEAGRPVDASGELHDGTRFEGPRQLKTALMARKDLFVRNLTSKMLGYALGRSLTLEDSCTIDSVVDQVKAKNYSSHALIEGIVLSVPFRYAASGMPQAESKRKAP